MEHEPFEDVNPFENGDIRYVSLPEASVSWCQPVPAGFSPVTSQFVALRPYSLRRQIAVGWLKFAVGSGQQVLGERFLTFLDFFFDKTHVVSN